MNSPMKISEETIREIIAKFYNIRVNDVCLYHDYRFILKNGDKTRKDFIYGIIEKQEDLGKDSNNNG